MLMKKVYILLTVLGLMASACYETVPGPPGRDGFDGYDGLDGVDGEESYVFEYEFSFTAPNYTSILSLPDNFAMLDSDVMLVYFLWEVTEDNVEIWRALPQTLYLADGILNYNFDFTKYDASVFLDGTTNFDLLGANFTDNWIARMVVVPGQFVNGRSAIDFSNYNEVKELLNLSESKLASPDYTKRPE